MKVLTILSTGHTLTQDIEKYGIIGDVMVVNHSITDYSGHIDYAISIHKHLLESWMVERAEKNLNTSDVQLIYDDAECKLPVNTSGLLALWKSQQLDYDLVRVLGMPADNRGHYYDPDNEHADDFKSRFPFDNDQWLTEFSQWGNIRIASGNLLKLFPQIDS